MQQDSLELVTRWRGRVMDVSRAGHASTPWSAWSDVVALTPHGPTPRHGSVGVEIGPGGGWVFRHGDVEVAVRRVRAGAAMPRPWQFPDAEFTRALLGVVGVAMVLALAARLAPPPTEDRLDLLRRVGPVVTRMPPPASPPRVRPTPPRRRQPTPTTTTTLRSTRTAPNSRQRMREQVHKVGVLAAIGQSRGALARVLGSGGGEVESLLAGLQGPSGPQVAGGGETRGMGPGGGGFGGVADIGALGRGPGGGGVPDPGLGGPHRGQVRSGVRDLTATDGLSREEVARVVARHLSRLRHCYERELNAQPNLAGKVVVAFTVGGRGLVTASDVAESTMDHAAVEQCVTRVVQSMVFPAPRGGGTVQVNYPLVFQSGG